jgi:hypothetical protein
VFEALRYSRDGRDVFLALHSVDGVCFRGFQVGGLSFDVYTRIFT